MSSSVLVTTERKLIFRFPFNQMSDLHIIARTIFKLMLDQEFLKTKRCARIFIHQRWRDIWKPRSKAWGVQTMKHLILEIVFRNSLIQYSFWICIAKRWLYFTCSFQFFLPQDLCRWGRLAARLNGDFSLSLYSAERPIYPACW